MIVEEKVLLAMSRLGKSDRPESGLYVEGFEGGISLYAFNGYSLFRRNLFGDNTRKFTQNFPECPVKRIDSTGYVPSKTFTNSEKIVNSDKKPTDMVERFKKILDQIETPHQAFARVKAYDLYKAVQAVTVIQKGETQQSAVLSFHNGFLNVAAWSGKHGYSPGEEFAVWEEVSPAVQIEGSCLLEKTALIALRSKGEIIIDLINQMGVQIFRFRTAEMDSAVMPLIIDEEDAEIFRAVLGYQYQPPKATGIIEESPVVELVAPNEKKPRTKKPAVKKAPKVEAAPVEAPAPVVTKSAPVPSTKEVTITIYGDSEGWWVRFPKKIIEKYNLWGNITEASWESKILIFCPEGTETEQMLDVIRNDGYVVNIVRHPRETKKSSICFLPHYQGAVNYQKVG
jgi:hypothetical protein